MMDREQLKELREMLTNGDHPTKVHRAQLLTLVNAALVKPIEDEEILTEAKISYSLARVKEGENMSSTNSKISNQALNIMLQDIKGHKDGSESLLLPARQLEIVAALIEAELDRRTVVKTKDGWPVKGIRKDKDGITVSLDVRDMPDAFAYSHAIQEHLKQLRSESYKPESTGGQKMEPVFICSPYQGREDNYRLAKMYMAMAAERGYYPVAPHVMIHGVLNDHDEETRNGAIKVGLQLIDLCKTVLVFGDVFTPGMKEEIRYALDRNYRTETISSAECLIWLQEKYDMKRQAYDTLKDRTIKIQRREVSERIRED